MGNHMNFLCCNCSSTNSLKLRQPSVKASIVIQDRQVTLKKGDILGEESNALVLQTDLTLRLDFNLGRKVKEITEFLDPIDPKQAKYGESLLTRTSNIPYIFLAVLPPKLLDLDTSQSQYSQNTNKQYIFQSIYNIMDQCEKYLIQDISFPVLYPQSGKNVEYLIPFIMFLAIKSYMEDEIQHKSKNYLSNINIILDENEDINHFELAFCHIFYNKEPTAQLNSISSIIERSSHEAKDELEKFGRSYHKNNQQKKRKGSL